MNRSARSIIWCTDSGGARKVTAPTLNGEDEGETAFIAGDAVAPICSPGGEGRRYIEASGISHVRHTYTTLLSQKNEDGKVVQELLRHANSRITSTSMRKRE